MESMRGFFILGLAICSFLLYQAWQKDYGPQQPQQEVNEQFGQSNTVVDSKVKTGNLVEVVTDVLKVKIDRVGGDVVYAELNNYNRELKNEAEKVVLFDYRDRLYQAKSALLGTGAPDNQLPRATYSSQDTSYHLKDNQEELTVPLTWVNEEGVEFTKTFVFKRNNFEIGVQYKVINQSSNDRTYNFVAELIRDQKSTGLEEKSSFGMSPFIGVAYSPEERKYEKISFEDLAEEPVSVTREGGWIGYLQHYFISAWIPEQEEQIKITTTVKPNQETIIRFIQPTVSVAAQSEKVIDATLYVGPKILKRLEAAAPGLEKSLDLSWVWWIGLPIYKLM
ncbi:MAG: membrane protein insertase YidC, partial [Kangiella sp.]|nr:membrane protein insertase YidC [Kangiella sp.]